jgi:hypothetical protein
MGANEVSVVVTMIPQSASQERLTGFAHFWLRYVRGFSPHFHCQQSLRGVCDPRFRKGMPLGNPITLFDFRSFDYIYLCGVAPRRYPGLHLALKVLPGALIEAETYNGIRIRVEGAAGLDIPSLPDGFAGMSRRFTRCRNWQFGVAYYGLEGLKSELIRE